jgi:ubiquinone/menaquinone biosynthesis C-methylase UbiE
MQNIARLPRISKTGFLLVLVCSSLFTDSGTKSGFPGLTEKETVPIQQPDFQKYGKRAKSGLQNITEKRQIVYERLAEYLVNRFNLASMKGIGIDLGSGPGDLIICLAKKTENLYLLNADIDTWYAQPFAEKILENGLAYRTGFIFADACSLPFKSNYADLIVSRGSYQFWADLEKGLAEIFRVLRHGGIAFIGRGVAPTMLEDEVKSLSAKGLIGGPKYDPDKDAERFRELVKKLNITESEIIRHKPENPSLNYGVWLYFRKTNE